MSLNWFRRLFRKLFLAEADPAVELETNLGHPSLVGGFNPLTFIWYYDHVEGCAPDEACWTEVSEKLRLATNDGAPQALIGDYPPEQKSERLWEQVLWADQHGVLMKLNDWLFVCDEFDMERKKWQPGCAFHEIAYSLWKSYL
jgi:hypothetical protein